MGNPPKHSQFKKGQSGNPGGVPKDPVKAALKKLTVESYRDIVELTLAGNVDQLGEIVKDKTQPALKVAIAAAILTAIRKGDVQTVEKLLERVIGKVPEVVRVTGAVANTDLNSSEDKKKVRDLVAKFSSEF